MAVWIMQALCGPAGHALGAMALEAETADGLQALLRAELMSRMAAGAINPWCGLCGARVEGWRYEAGRSRYATMAEAEPALRASEAAQARTAALLKAQGRAYDAP